MSQEMGKGRQKQKEGTKEEAGQGWDKQAREFFALELQNRGLSFIITEQLSF